MTARRLDTFERHQLKIARATLRMNPAIVAVIGGPSIAEAKLLVAELTERKP
jgi:hypothetical protein